MIVRLLTHSVRLFFKVHHLTKHEFGHWCSRDSGWQFATQCLPVEAHINMYSSRPPKPEKKSVSVAIKGCFDETAPLLGQQEEGRGNRYGVSRLYLFRGRNFAF